jgi:hypothetical protein
VIADAARAFSGVGRRSHGRLRRDTLRWSNASRTGFCFPGARSARIGTEGKALINMYGSLWRGVLVGAVMSSCTVTAALAGGDDPFADQVISYEPGVNPAAGYTDPTAALGEPARYTGEGFDPTIVSAFTPPWRPDEIISLGAGGRLVVKFDTPVTNDPDNPYGIDLLVFGNAFFQDSWPLQHVVAAPASVNSEGGVIEVSVDGETWVTVPDLQADGVYPTEGYLDRTSPIDTQPGTVLSDFTLPVNPALTLADFEGLAYEQVLDLYAGSGGGMGIDLGALGLEAISYVAVTNPADALDTPEIDAIADVAPVRTGDTDRDGDVDVDDFFFLLQHWGPARPHGWTADFDANSVVDVTDFFTLLQSWGE